MVFGMSEEGKKEKERKKDPAQWTEKEMIERTEMINAGEIAGIFMMNQDETAIKNLRLPEPYIFLYDSNFGYGPHKMNNMARAVNILAKYLGYRVVTHTMSGDRTSPHYVCMIKQN
jgi:hypothetical protein